MVASRWRGASGEIDLIVREGAGVVFVEVKKAATHAEAALRLTSRQMARIYAAAAEFLAGEPAGQATDCRFDVALMDSYGRIEVLENAFSG
jgi:putative endonuclease